ncbi:Dynein heavy chain,cytoplasmic [Trichinella pseudospiralis]
MLNKIVLAGYLHTVGQINSSNYSNFREEFFKFATELDVGYRRTLTERLMDEVSSETKKYKKKRRNWNQIVARANMIMTHPLAFLLLFVMC